MVVRLRPCKLANIDRIFSGRAFVKSFKMVLFVSGMEVTIILIAFSTHTFMDGSMWLLALGFVTDGDGGQPCQNVHLFDVEFSRERRTNIEGNHLGEICAGELAMSSAVRAMYGSRVYARYA